jgi:hypothetical protein
MFFRWPSLEETLALSPDEVSDILEGHKVEESYELEKADAECALVDCQDLNLIQKNRFPSRNREIKIQLSTPLQYFLPSRLVKSTLLNDRELWFQIPAYNATARIYLGRAVTGEPAEYKVLVEP